jgi:hypothetical protein
MPKIRSRNNSAGPIQSGMKNTKTRNLGFNFLNFHQKSIFHNKVTISG